MCGLLAILPMCAVVLGGLCFILQFIVLPSDEWGHFASRRIRGIREEKGHFGLWRLCSVKSGSDVETCVHPQDPAYELPTYATTAGVVSILHLLLVAAFVVLACIRVIQIFKRTPDLHLGTKRLITVKVGVAIVCVVLSISVSILASVGEGTFRKFNVYKGWAFWIQILIISIDSVLLLICAFENIQWWQVGMAERPAPDPTDAFPETFVVPDYDNPDPAPLERVVYVKDAGVQSQLDGDDGRYLQVPDHMYRLKKKHREEVTFQEPTDVHFDTRGPTLIPVRGRDSPHPKKKNTAPPTRVI